MESPHPLPGPSQKRSALVAFGLDSTLEQTERSLPQPRSVTPLSFHQRPLFLSPTPSPPPCKRETSPFSPALLPAIPMSALSSPDFPVWNLPRPVPVEIPFKQLLTSCSSVDLRQLSKISSLAVRMATRSRSETFSLRNKGKQRSSGSQGPRERLLRPSLIPRAESPGPLFRRFASPADIPRSPIDFSDFDFAPPRRRGSLDWLETETLLILGNGHEDSTEFVRLIREGLDSDNQRRGSPSNSSLVAWLSNR